MREIKFRGKDNNGNWILGDLIAVSHKAWIKDTNDKTTNPRRLDQDFADFRCVEVEKATVGQYTGVNDKNGKEIFEGDVVEAWSQGAKAVGEVRRRIDGLWLMFPAYQRNEFWGLCPNENGETSVEIIGNIHENPEWRGEEEE